MFENIKDAREISLSDVLNGNYITKNHEYKTLDENTAYELYRKFRAFVADTARGNRRQRIANAQSTYLKNYGIFRRLVYDFQRERVEYIAGQDYIAEMGILRDCFDR